MSGAPVAQASHIFPGSERGAGPLICFDLLREASLEIIERSVGGAKAIREWHLDEPRIEIADPIFQHWNAAGLLCAKRAAVKSVGERDDDIFRAAALREAVSAAQLDSALHSFRAGGEQKNLLERLRQEAGEFFHQPRTNLAGESIAGQ